MAPRFAFSILVLHRGTASLKLCNLLCETRHAAELQARSVSFRACYWQVVDLHASVVGTCQSLGKPLICHHLDHGRIDVFKVAQNDDGKFRVCI
jgi:hypothetical protein